MDYKSKILSFLLTKYEKSKTFLTGEKSLQRPQLSLVQANELAEHYNDEMDYRKREQINEVLQDLINKGFIEVRWKRWEDGRVAEKVFLQYNAIEQAYKEAGMTPKTEKMNEVLQVLKPLSSHSYDWVRDWYEDVDQSFQHNKTAGLDFNNIQVYRYLVTALVKLDSLEDSIPKRIFSQLVFGDTKLFENEVQKRLLSVYKKYGRIEYETDDEYLESVGILENIQPVYIKGDAYIHTKTGDFSLSSFPDGVGLMNETVKELEIRAIHSDRILLIENMTPYYVQLQQTSDALMIYTGGFPKKNVQHLFYKIAEHVKCQPIPVYHSGDLDYGGIMIFEYIKRNFFPQLQPYRMNVQTFQQYVDYGTAFEESYERKLKKLLDEPSYAIWHEVIQVMLQYKRRIEQEVMLY